MRNYLKLVTLSTLLFFALITEAKEPKIVTEIDSKSMVFELEAPSKGTSVKLYDNQGNIIYFESVSGGEAFAKRFDLNKLELGNYYLKVDDSVKEITYTLLLNATDVAVIGRNENHKPVFIREEGKLLMNLLNLDGNAVTVSVLDGENRTLFSQNINGNTVIEKAFNFENALKDSYTVVVKNGKDTFYETVVVE
ncbi:MAG: hypothetical protein E4H26_06335 [Flavobacteriales bacterium]|nr:MAG: hypothetical protein E4H26_06335 [Flavobacteriales bacterium]